MSSKGRGREEEYIVKDELGGKKIVKLTKKQKAFIDEYLKSGNATQAALKTYDTEDYKTANMIGSKNLAKDSIRAFLHNDAHIAKNSIMEIVIGGENEANRLNAAKFVVEQVHGKARGNASIESGGGNITVNMANFS